MARIADREPCSDDEAWEHVTDSCERRRIQNRNNQRAFRRRRICLRQTEQVSNKTIRTAWPVLLPKHQVPSSALCLPSAPTNTPEPETGIESPCEDLVLRERVMKPSLFGVHEINATNLDMNSRRIFHYASTWLWPLLRQKVLDRDETVAMAMTRLALSHPLTLDMFIWTAAAELEMHGTSPVAHKVMLKHQMRVMRTIRDDIQSNNISDELINAIYALVVMDTPVGEFKTWEEFMYGPEPSPYGDYDPPLASLGYLLRFSQMEFSDRHADVASRLLRSRGGLVSMQIVEFAYAMQALDLVRSSKNASRPAFDLCKPYRRILETQMPLCRCDKGNRSALYHKYPIGSEFNTLLMDLQSLVRQLDLLQTCCSPSVSTETLIAWRNINQHRLLSLPDDQDQLFRLATLIFSYNVTFPVPFREVVEKWTKELIPHLRQASETSEDALWATVIAALTRPDEETLDFLRNRAREMTKSQDIKSWHELKNVLVKYLWLDGSCDAGGISFWNSIASFDSILEAERGVVYVSRANSIHLL